jgi:hypothetical protein
MWRDSAACDSRHQLSAAGGDLDGDAITWFGDIQRQRRSVPDPSPQHAKLFA